MDNSKVDVFGAIVERALADDSPAVAENLASALREKRASEDGRAHDDSLAQLMFGWAVEDALEE